MSETPFAERRETLAALIAGGLTFAECVRAFHDRQTPEENAYIDRAQHDEGEREVRDGELEVDDFAIVSLGEDPGAYVMAWLWVPAPDPVEADEEEPTECPHCGGLHADHPSCYG